MANVLLLGATGKFGVFFGQKLIDATNHNVTLFSRHVDESDADGDRIRAIKGDASMISDLSNALEGQDIVYCAISGAKLPEIAKNIVDAMTSTGVDRLIYMGAVGVYDEIPEETGGAKYNLANDPAQIPNHKGVEIIENSDLQYTILRPGLLRAGDPSDYVITTKGQPAKGYMSTIESVADLAIAIIDDPSKYLRESVSITRDMTK